MFTILRREEGATAVEYAIMVSLIAGAIVITVGLMADQLNIVFQKVITTLGG